MKWSAYDAPTTAGIIFLLLQGKQTWDQITAHFNHHNPSTLFRWYKRYIEKYPDLSPPPKEDNGSALDFDVKAELQALANRISSIERKLISPSPQPILHTDPTKAPPAPGSGSNGEVITPEGYKRKTVSSEPALDPALRSSLVSELKKIGKDFQSILTQVEGEVRRCGTSD